MCRYQVNAKRSLCVCVHEILTGAETLTIPNFNVSSWSIVDIQEDKVVFCCSYCTGVEGCAERGLCRNIAINESKGKTQRRGTEDASTWS